jgi:hypothetical protein
VDSKSHKSESRLISQVKSNLIQHHGDVSNRTADQFGILVPPGDPLSPATAAAANTKYPKEQLNSYHSRFNFGKLDHAGGR